MRGGLSGTAGSYNHFAEIDGALAVMDNQWFAANQVNDSFVVVSTDGFEGVPVKYENQVVGHTNGSGYFLVPWSTAYYTAKYAIDPLGLPANAQMPEIEQFASVHAGYGYLLRFPIRLQVALSLTVTDSLDQYLPLGTYGVSESGLSGQIGWDGMVYFEGIEPGRFVTFYPVGSLPCRVWTEGMYTRDVEGIQTLGSLRCYPLNQGSQP
ncbi:fimbria/pilus outer membrane usher protein [Photobacterium sp. TY1-4]|nr:fimbria/pilus outer membrane usher protein [Photobacterium sp. TY1-4]